MIYISTRMRETDPGESDLEGTCESNLGVLDRCYCKRVYPMRMQKNNTYIHKSNNIYEGAHACTYTHSQDNGVLSRSSSIAAKLEGDSSRRLLEYTRPCARALS